MMTRTIKFKSMPEIWKKEYLGLKCNTLRKFDDDKDFRLEILEKYLLGEYNLINIEITNIKTGEKFVREITDITYWEEYYIISWKYI